MDKTIINYDRLREAYVKKFYGWKEGKYNLNVCGIRSNDTTPDAFNDLLCVAYQDENGAYLTFVMQGTTDPGTYWLKNPMNQAGCFVLCPGQYLNSHKLGLHQGKIPAMVQIGRLKGWRDNDRDNIVDMDGNSFYEGNNFGVNIHPMGDVLKSIYNWSAGCQGASTADINSLLALVHKQLEATGTDKIDYTLFVENDFA